MQSRGKFISTRVERRNTFLPRLLTWFVKLLHWHAVSPFLGLELNLRFNDRCRDYYNNKSTYYFSAFKFGISKFQFYFFFHNLGSKSTTYVGGVLIFVKWNKFLFSFDQTRNHRLLLETSTSVHVCKDPASILILLYIIRPFSSKLE